MIRSSVCAALACFALSTPALAADLPAPMPSATVPTLPTAAPAGDAAALEPSSGGRRVNKAKVITGACLFGGVYLHTSFAGFVAADTETDTQGLWAVVPVVGPVVWAASPGGSHASNYLLGLSAIAQGTGAALLISGINHGRNGGGAAVSVAPSLAPGHAGVTAAGRF